MTARKSSDEWASHGLTQKGSSFSTIHTRGRAAYHRGCRLGTSKRAKQNRYVNGGSIHKIVVVGVEPELRVLVHAHTHTHSHTHTHTHTPGRLCRTRCRSDPPGPRPLRGCQTHRCCCCRWAWLGRRPRTASPCAWPSRGSERTALWSADRQRARRSGTP